MIHNSPQNVQTLETDWWFLFDAEYLKMITEPQLCVGYTDSPYSMFIGNTLEECEEYIKDNGIMNNLSEDISIDFIEN